MTGLNVLYYGGLWPTNIGNSFIDLGALNVLRRSSPNANIHMVSRFSRFYAQHRKNNRLGFLNNQWKALDVAEIAKVDYVVVAGNVTHTEFIEVEGPTIKKLVDRGAKFIILGGGCSVYNENEFRKFEKFMKTVSTYAFVSRDSHSYEAYAGAAMHSFSGIDCGFFVADEYKPLPLDCNDYVVFSFDDQSLESTINLKEEIIFRTRHYCFGIRERFIKKLDNTLVSDIPNDYLTLYANSSVVYSDRVHACVAALSYGRGAKLFSNTLRAKLFFEVLNEDITKKVVQVDKRILNTRKEEEVNWLSSLII